MAKSKKALNSSRVAALENLLLSRTAASSFALISALSFSLPLSAETRVWQSGVSKFDPAAIAVSKIPVPVFQSDGKWIIAGEIKTPDGKTLSGAIDQASFAQLVTEANGGKILVINQNTGRLILDWNEFNIGANSEVKFVQPETTSLALNEISNSTSPSAILGKLTSNGGVYLINHNGIYFGKNSQVNVGSLVASSLDVDEDLFINKSLSKALTDNQTSAFFIQDKKDATGDVFQTSSADGSMHLASELTNKINSQSSLRGDVLIDSGAKINSTTLNGVVVVAPNVVNAGEIKSPDGQTILAAAKDDAYVLFSPDPALRGLLIEVNTGGDSSNLGKIIAERGNITLAGAAINLGKNSSLQATTSVDFNGSVRLLARDHANSASAIQLTSVDQVAAFLDTSNVTEHKFTNYQVAQNGGQISIASSATVKVDPELDSKKTAPDAQTQRLSAIEISGNQIDVAGKNADGNGAQIIAQGGNVFFSAVHDLSQNLDLSKTKDTADTNKTYINLGSGSLVDVSGVQVDLAMSRNMLQVELRGTELADSPLQRQDSNPDDHHQNDFLYGKKITVDIRKGTPLADISGAMANVAKGVGERLTKGGTVKIISEGQVSVDQGANINLSGGGIHYQAGYINTTNLISDGKIINVADADPNKIYTGILGRESYTNKKFNVTTDYQNFFVTHDQGEYVDAFSKGDSAGNFSLYSRTANLQGSFNSGTFIGPDQRNSGQSNAPGNGNFLAEIGVQNIVIGAPVLSTKSQGDVSLQSNDSINTDLIISDDFFNQSHFGNYSINARDGVILVTENSNIKLTAGANLSLKASDTINFNGKFNSQGGNFELVTHATGIGGINSNESVDNIQTNPSDNLLNRSIVLGENAVVDTSGSWINDNPLLIDNKDRPISAITINAGAINLNARGDLNLSSGAQLIANGGGWLDKSATLTAGKGGDINLSAVSLSPSTQSTNLDAANIFLGAQLSSYAFNKGGTLSITAPSIHLSSNELKIAQASPLLEISNQFFDRGGFSGFKLTAKGSSQWVSHFDIDNFIDIAPKALNYSKGVKDYGLTGNINLNNLATGTNLYSKLGVAQLPDFERNPVNLSFNFSDQSRDGFHTSNARDNLFYISAGVRFLPDPKASISFSSNTGLVFDGTIKDSGGSVGFNFVGSDSINSFVLNNLDDTGIWIGSNSSIDLSSSFIANPNKTPGLNNLGKIIDAGNLNISVDRGFVVLDRGSKMDISAKPYPIDSFITDDKVGQQVQTINQSANAGTLNIRAAEGLILAGDVNASGAGSGALGGTFTFDFSRSYKPPITLSGVAEQDLLNFDYSKISYAERQLILTDLSQKQLANSSVQKLSDADENFLASVSAISYQTSTSGQNQVVLGNFGKTNAIDIKFDGKTYLDVNRLESSGFDSYKFSTGFILQPDSTITTNKAHPERSGVKSTQGGVGRTIFDGNIALVAGRSIELNLTTLASNNGRALITAPYISVGRADSVNENNDNNYLTATTTGGAGEFVFSATNLDVFKINSAIHNDGLANELNKKNTSDILILLNQKSADGLLSLNGFITTQGADNVTLTSAGDIRAQGQLIGDGKGDNARYLGSFSTYKNLNLQADQIYPTTLSEFVFSSGQYNFSKASQNGSDTYELQYAGSSSFTLNKTNAVQFDLEYVDADGNTKQVTEYATTYEAFDVLEGKINVGDSVTHPRGGNRDTSKNIDPKDPVTKKILAIKTPIRDTSGATDGSIKIFSGGASSSTNSVAGSIIFDAPTITQSGTVKAPFGQIIFNGHGSNSTVNFTEGSLTSVSANNLLMPFGELDASGTWVYRVDPSNSDIGVRLFNSTPARGLVVNASNIDMQNNSTVDLSGVGDLFSYRFVPGPGGSKDVLNAANSGKSFAIVPSYNSNYAPYDPDINLQTGNTNAHRGVGIGEKVYLSGTTGLPAGEYTILPATYALMPGAFLITPTSDGQVYSPTQHLHRVDGTPIVAGRFLQANTGEYDSAYSGFYVEPGSIVNTRSELVVAKASDQFSTSSIKTQDAGKLSILANQTINLNSDYLTKAATGGRGASLDISADHLVLTSAIDPNQSGTQVLVNQLNNFDSLLIGGSSRLNTDSSLSINALATQVEITKNTNLNLPQITLVAKGIDATHPGLIQIDSGSSIATTGIYLNSYDTINLLGDAIVMASSGGAIKINQTTINKANIALQQNATLHSDKGFVALISDGQTQLNGSLQMQGGSLNLGADQISLGDANTNLSGLHLTNQQLAQLNVDQLTLTSRNNLDFYGAVNLNLKDLNLQSSSLRSFTADNPGNANSAANVNLNITNRLTLSGNQQSLPNDLNSLGISGNKNQWIVTAKEILFDQGNLAIAGFDSLNLTATSALLGQNIGAVKIYGANNVNLTTPYMTSLGAADTQLMTDGKLTISGNGNSTNFVQTSGLGARWNIAADSIDFNTRIYLPSGDISIAATKNQNAVLHLGVNAQLDVLGQLRTFNDQTKSTDAGTIQISNASSDILIDSTAQINLSGVAGANGSNAGTLNLSALAGEVLLNGIVKTQAGDLSQAASLNLSENKMTDFSQTLRWIEAAHFNQSIDVRVASGDLNLASSDQVHAKNISFTADQGVITLSGLLDASGGQGKININAGKDLTLKSTATISVAADSSDQSGSIFLGARDGFINLEQGAQVDLTGGGSWTLRVPRTYNGVIATGNQAANDVAIKLIGASNFHLQDLIRGNASTVDIDAVKVYAASNTSEIFNTDELGQSTLQTVVVTLPYGETIPFASQCASDQGCDGLVDANNPQQADKSTNYYQAFNQGDALPTGAICANSFGCTISFEINQTTNTIAYQDTYDFMSHAQQVETRLFANYSIKDIYHVKPEIEIKSSGNLNVDKAIDFAEGVGVVDLPRTANGNIDTDAFDPAAPLPYWVQDDLSSSSSLWRYQIGDEGKVFVKVYDPSLFDYQTNVVRYQNGEAGVLTLKSTGNLSINAPITDGFSVLTSAARTGEKNGYGYYLGVSDEKNSWSFNLISGEDLAAANSLSVKQFGNIFIADNVKVRTSTGNIQVYSAQDILLGTQSAIYTSGRASGRGVMDNFALKNDGIDYFEDLLIPNATYGIEGGSISLNAHKNLIASADAIYTNDWLQRLGGLVDDNIGSFFGQNKLQLPTTIAIVPEYFNQGVGTLGGGDINIIVNGDIKNLTVALPTTLKSNVEYNPSPKVGENIFDLSHQSSVWQWQGGGNLFIKSGGDLIGGQFMLGKGQANISVAGEIGSSNNLSAPVVQLMDGEFNLTAGGNLQLGGIYNPTTQKISGKEAGVRAAVEGAVVDQWQYQNVFFSYGSDSGLSLRSLSGNIQINGFSPQASSKGFNINSENIAGIDQIVLPAKLESIAYQGNISIDTSGQLLNLFPSTKSTFQLLAANNIQSTVKSVINIMDVDPDALPNSLNPVDAALNAQTIEKYFHTDANYALIHASTSTHQNNSQSVNIVAQAGDISNLNLYSPTFTWVYAGRDISNVTFEFQNLHPNDVSYLQAGRDISFETPRSVITNLVQTANVTQGVDVAGYGRLDLIAGRDIKLGASRGINSIGAQHNPYLLRQGFGEESGAEINLLSGAEHMPDYATFINQYFNNNWEVVGASNTADLIKSANDFDTNVRANAEKFIKTMSGLNHKDYFSGVKLQDLSDSELSAFVKVARDDFSTMDLVHQEQFSYRLLSNKYNNYEGDLIELVTSNSFGSGKLDAADLLTKSLQEQHDLALTAFKNASQLSQKSLVFQSYFNEIKRGGIEDASHLIVDKDTDGFARSRAAIQILFPNPNQSTDYYHGNISLIFSTVQTQQGGNINLLVPGGYIDVGAAAVGGGVTKDPSKLGLIALRNGNINAVANNNISVNASRVFALDGGDIMLWSTLGNVDAGRGAKSALSVPPPIINEDGSVNFQAAVAGSGIRNSRFTQNRAPGAVYLFAPSGVVNAGDAGIGSQGDVLIAAQQVIGADNIDVGGVSVGVPVSTGVSASVANAGASTGSAADSATKDSLNDASESADQNKNAFITVDILGFDF